MSQAYFHRWSRNTIRDDILLYGRNCSAISAWSVTVLGVSGTVSVRSTWAPLESLRCSRYMYAFGRRSTVGKLWLATLADLVARSQCRGAPFLLEKVLVWMLVSILECTVCQAICLDKLWGRNRMRSKPWCTTKILYFRKKRYLSVTVVGKVLLRSIIPILEMQVAKRRVGATASAQSSICPTVAIVRARAKTFFV